MAENEDEPDARRTDEAEAARGGADDGGAPPSRESAAVQTDPRHRRLHTLSGAVVLGAFLVEHLLTNASALGGGASYDAVVGAIVRWSLLPLFEVVFIAIPLAFHAGYGLLLLRRGASASEVARFGGRRAWVLQRLSAAVLLVFVLVHVWELRLQRLFFGLPADGLYTTLTSRLSWTWAGVPWMALFYLVGVLAAGAHLANGLFAATEALGLATKPAGRRRVRIATTGLGLILVVIGSATVIGLATGTRLLPGADDDSAARSAPCGSAAPEPTPPFVLPAPSR